MQGIGSSKQLLMQFESSPTIEETAKILSEWPSKTLMSLERCRWFQLGGGFIQGGKFTDGILQPCEKGWEGIYSGCKKHRRDNVHIYENELKGFRLGRILSIAPSLKTHKTRSYFAWSY